MTTDPTDRTVLQPPAPEFAGADRCAERHRDVARRCRVRAARLLRWAGRNAEHRALAHRGLRYNNFHTTALCSPSRGALLTGRNHHPIGLAATGYPGGYGSIPRSAAMISDLDVGQLADLLAVDGDGTPAPKCPPNTRRRSPSPATWRRSSSRLGAGPDTDFEAGIRIAMHQD